jgi:hypothetical protein
MNTIKPKVEHIYDLQDLIDTLEFIAADVYIDHGLVTRGDSYLLKRGELEAYFTDINDKYALIFPLTRSSYNGQNIKAYRLLTANARSFWSLLVRDGFEL